MRSFIDALLIIIVTYNRALEDSESFQSINQMKSRGTNLDLFVYDNSKTPQLIKENEGMAITYVHDPMNSGVSKAYNAGVDHAKQRQKKWVLLLDHDTTLPNTILDAYYNATKTPEQVKLVAPILVLKDEKIFSPCTYKFKRGFHLKEIADGVHSLYKTSPVNSGMLVNVEAFINVGGYNDKVKLDFSDFQFIERFRKKYPDFYVLDVKCHQDFSDDEVSYESQSNRFKYYCEGAKNIEKQTILDTVQYVIVVGTRALMLSMRYRKLTFILTYFNSFLLP